MRLKVYLYLFFSLLLFGVGHTQMTIVTPLTTTPIACSGDETASITVNIINGTGPYRYQLAGRLAATENSALTNHTFSDLPGGDYIVIVTDLDPVNFALDAKTLTIDTLIAVTFPATIVLDESCLGTGDGAINISPVGGTLPYTSTVWSNGATTEDITDLVGANYTVTITDTKGCTYDTTMTVNPGIEVVADFTAPAPDCQGEPMVFTDASIGSPDSYLWNFASGATPATDGTATPPIVTYSSSGTKSVSLTVTKGVCSDVISKNITVVALPTADITPVADLCLNDTPVNLTLTGGSVGGGTFSGAGVTGATFNPTTAGVGTHTVSYEVTDNGCTKIATTTIEVLALPNPTFGAIPDICESASTYTLTEGSAPLGGTYSGAGIATSPTFDPIIGDGTYTLTYTVTVGTCTGGTTQTITVLPQAVATLAPLGPFCEGDGAVALPVGSPLGGTYTGTGVVGANFSPITAGVGTHTITYTIIGATCSGDATTDVVVKPLPVADITPVADLCLNDTPVNLTLTGGSVGGGTFSGAGITGSTFNPTTAGVGIHTITYSITVNGCTTIATTTIEVLALPNPVFGAIPDICESDAPYTLTEGSAPLGGTYSGAGIATSPTFDPIIGDGTYTLTYTVTVGTCTGSTTQLITVLPQAVATLAPLGPFCEGDGAVALPVGSPLGGTYTGTGVVGANFSPITAGVGTHTITYTIIGATCSGDATTDVVVKPLPVADITPVADLCLNDTPVNLTLTGGSVGGGTFSGAGITGSTFNPTTAGVGIHTITYSITVNGCTTIATTTIEVLALPNPVFGAIPDICENIPAFDLTQGTPTGGTYSGTGITVNPTFDPAVATAGTHTITYTLQNATCSNTATQTVTVLDVPVVTLVTPGPFCENDVAVTLVGGLPLGGDYSGTGVTASPTFDPAVATAGNHTITYTFVNTGGCAGIATSDIEVKTLPLVTIDPLGPLCLNGTPVPVTGTPVTGGFYSPIVTVGATPMFDPSAVPGDGVYPVTHTFIDPVSGCKNTATTPVTVLPLPAVTLAAMADVCMSDATFPLVGGLPAGGTYSGTGVVGGTNFNPLLAGGGAHTITYTFTDGSGCAGTATTPLTVNPGTPATFTGTPDVCLNNGVLTLNGGTPTVGGIGTYSGSGVTGTNFNPMTAGIGTHTLIYTFDDGSGCPSIATDEIEVFAIPTIVLTPILAMCKNDASITLTQGTPTGGVYSGTGITTSPTFDPATALDGVNTITYSFTDANGCTNTPATTDIIVNPLPVVVITATPSATICEGETVQLSATGVGTHSWAPVDATIDDATSATPNVTPTVTTTYTDVVTSGAGCTTTETIEITVNPLPKLTASSDAVICEKDSVELTVTSDIAGGFSWAPMASVVNPTSGVTYVKPTVATTYTIEVTSLLGCKETATINVNVNAKPTGTFTTPNATICAEQTATFTATLDPAFTIAPTGGYSYDKGVTYVGVNTTTISGAVTGTNTASVLLKDEFGCVSDTLKETVTALAPILFTVDEIAEPTCLAPTLGEFHVKDIQGGQANYTVTVNADVRANVLPTDVNVYDNLPIAVYAIEVEGAFGCTATKTVAYQGNMTFDPILSHLKCNGDTDGFISIQNVQGGTAPYEFSFEGGAYSANATFINKSAGTYIITIKDATGCEVPVSVTLNEPDLLVPALDLVVNETCTGLDDGKVTVSAVGGNPRYLFVLNGTPKKALIAEFTNIAVGPHTITLVDTLGCQASIPFDILPATPIVTTIVATDATDCTTPNGFGTITSTVGGSGNFNYSADGGATFKDNVNIIPDMQNKGVGIYTIITKDIINNCTVSDTYSVGAVGSLDVSKIIQKTTGESCAENDGTDSLSNFIGTPGPFQFQLHSLAVIPGDPNPVLVAYQADSSFANLVSGSYYIKIKDPTGCEYTKPFTISPPVPIAISSFSTPADCGLANGSLNVTVSGGLAPYTYVLNKTLTQTTGVFPNMLAGSYTIDITDASLPVACSVVSTVSVSTTAAGLQFDKDSTTCSYSSDGKVTLTALTNTDFAIYDYLVGIDDIDAFKPYANGVVFDGLTSGLHSLQIKQVTKIGGFTCTYNDFQFYTDTVYLGQHYDLLIQDRFLIYAPDTIKAKTLEVPAVKDEDDGEVSIFDVTNAVPPYEFGLDLLDLNPYSLTDPSLNYIKELGKGEYVILLKDANGCIGEFKQTVTTSFYIPNVFTPNGDGKNDVFEVKGLPDNSRLRVYDRWGTRVFFINDYENDWDGGRQPDGIYFFELKTEINGTFKGWVQIIR